MANLLFNDPTQTVPAAAAAQDDLEAFRQATRNFAELAQTTMAAQGAAKQALVASAGRVRDAGERYYAMAEPRIASIRASAEDSTRVGDEGANALNAVDVAF